MQKFLKTLQHFSSWKTYINLPQHFDTKVHSQGITCQKCFKTGNLSFHLIVFCITEGGAWWRLRQWAPSILPLPFLAFCYPPPLPPLYSLRAISWHRVLMQEFRVVQDWFKGDIWFVVARGGMSRVTRKLAYHLVPLISFLTPPALCLETTCNPSTLDGQLLLWDWSVLDTPLPDSGTICKCNH